MIPITITGKKWKSGNSWVITIPPGICGLLEQGQDYKFTITEVGEDE